ncbi:uncharacterized protein LOC133744696 [Rosa rugosa]|uniref:uncharacterized protein LOC133744696 n=1 Tax=Rosa rugosa TaxID=74645 RepID=UPI002B415791|nr:uncharacterized protein LOC133744696 [Rosa rugosa]
MDARLEAGASYTWRSILAGRRVLCTGMRFQVGSGHDISVWDDKWLPVPYNFKPFSLPMEGLEDLKVVDLIDPDVKAWQLDLLQELFTPHEVDVIASIPLSLRHTEDRLVWHFDKKGCYNVKSGYFAWREAREASSTASSSSNATGRQLGRYWAAVWKMHVPAKVKAETSLHIFKECTAIKSFWLEGPLKLAPHNHPAPNICEWMWSMIDTLSTEEQGLFCTSLWAVWAERNKVLWQGSVLNPASLAQWVGQYLEVFQTYHYKPSVKQKRLKTKWECPPSGRLKINVDGAFRIAHNCGGIGVVVRNDAGVGVTTLARPHLHAHSALHMEVEECRAGLLLGIHQGWTDVDIESDSILLITALSRDEEDLSEVGRVLEDCKAYMTVF